MSLLNQMLKDLEHRKPPASMSKQTLLAEFKTHPTPPLLADKRLYYLPFAALLIGFSAYLVWPHPASISHKTSPAPHATRAAVSLPLGPSSSLAAFVHADTNTFDAFAPTVLPGPPQMPSILPPRALVQAMNVTGKPSKTHLGIALTHGTLYGISSDPKKDELLITLDNSYLTQAFSNIDTFGTAIKSVDVKNSHDGSPVKLRLALRPGTELQQLDLKTTPTPELVFDFSNRTAEDAFQTAPTLHAISTELPSFSLHKVKESDTKAYAKPLYKRALGLIQHRETDLAKQELTTLLTHAPRYAPARESLASLFIQEGLLNEAERTLQTGLQLQPERPGFLKLQARILMSRGELQSALETLQTASPALEKDPDYYATMAALYQRLNQPAVAAKWYEQLLHTQPDNAVWWMGLGIALEGVGNNNGSLDAYQKARDSGRLTPPLAAYVASRIQMLGG